ncbi:MAG: pentapeptide repeat-containing protein [Cyanobacteria bacterium P01_A01_bin.116]
MSDLGLSPPVMAESLSGSGLGRLSSQVVRSPRVPLTLDLLDARIAAPIRQGGSQVIDLRNVIIDLREPDDQQLVETAKQRQSSQPSFSEQFYQRLQQGLNQPSLKPSGLNGSASLGLDLSYSLIQGDLDLSRLSLRVPAYGGLAVPKLEAFNQKFQPMLSKDAPAESAFLAPRSNAFRAGAFAGSTRGSRALARSFLIQPQAVLLDTFAFQGPLLLSQTCFTGAVSAANLYFLSRVEAPGAVFTQLSDWRGARFARAVDFSRGQFQQESRFRGALFAGRSRFNQGVFNSATHWEAATFYGAASFAQADFQAANFARTHWLATADFDQAQFHHPVTFQKGRFDQALFLTDGQFEAATNFRQAQFQMPISLRGAHILNQLDFGDARFSRSMTINVADLDFNPGEAKILGSPGMIGRVFSVPALASNETVLRNLVRNFRLLEQIGDANQLEYTTERLRLKTIARQLLGLGLNQATRSQLEGLGLSAPQAEAVVARAQQQPFVSHTDLLSLDEIDLASYLKVRDRVTTKSTSVFNRCQRLIAWGLLAGLLLLSQYGTNAGLTFGVGLIAMTIFALIFWLVDRYRRRLPTPIVPTRGETVYMLCGAAGILLLALSLIGQSSRPLGGSLGSFSPRGFSSSVSGQYPIWTLVAVAVVALPIPLAMVARLYQQGRYHDLMDRSYFVENGALRKLQVLIARLPIVPKYPFYRDRYIPLLLDTRWNWLNYFDFSFNNWFKFGFNDIRLRDSQVPGLISALVWFQWVLGVAYVALLLWTLSRTIPGLNLLLYF